MQIDRTKIYRYLGLGTAAPDAATRTLAESCLAELQQAAAPRAVYRRFPLQQVAGGVQLGPLRLESTSLAKHLQGCGEALLFAATLGAPVDRLLARYAVADVARAAVLQACAAAAAERFCDEFCAALPVAPLFLRPRYSPGYGDLPLALQPKLLELLDAPRQIGLCCTEHAVLTPTKSVTAIIGLSADESCHTEKCTRCENIHCPFRKE